MAIKIECYRGFFGQTYTSSGNPPEFIERGVDFKLVDIALDSDTGEIYYTVECKKLGKKTRFVISKKDALDKKKVLEYACHGLDVTSSNASIVPEVFSIKEDEYIEAKKPISKVHSIAGVKEVITEGKRSFIYAGYTNPLTGSKYIGHLNLEPKGEKEAWFDFVKAEMVDSIETQFTVSFSFSPILHSTLEELIDVDNFVVHYRGDSTASVVRYKQEKSV